MIASSIAKAEGGRQKAEGKMGIAEQAYEIASKILVLSCDDL